MLAAMAYVAAVAGRIPVVLFLKYDPKDIIITLGGLIWGPLTFFVLSVIVLLIEMVTTVFQALMATKIYSVWAHTFHPVTMDRIKLLMSFCKKYPDIPVIFRHFGGFCLHCYKNGNNRTAGKMPVQFRCALWGTIFIQAAHRIYKPGQADGGNGIGGKYFPVTETALRRNEERTHRPFFLFRKPLGKRRNQR